MLQVGMEDHDPVTGRDCTPHRAGGLLLFGFECVSHGKAAPMSGCILMLDRTLTALSHLTAAVKATVLVSTWALKGFS